MVEGADVFVNDKLRLDTNSSVGLSSSNSYT